MARDRLYPLSSQFTVTWGGNIIFVFPDPFLCGGLTPLMTPIHLAISPARRSQCPPPRSSQQLVQRVEGARSKPTFFPEFQLYEAALFLQKQRDVSSFIQFS